MDSDEEGFDYNWTTGNDISLIHCRLIDSGAFGDVHEVLCPSLFFAKIEQLRSRATGEVRHVFIILRQAP